MQSTCFPSMPVINIHMWINTDYILKSTCKHLPYIFAHIWSSSFLVSHISFNKLNKYSDYFFFSNLNSHITCHISKILSEWLNLDPFFMCNITHEVKIDIFLPSKPSSLNINSVLSLTQGTVICMNFRLKDRW